MASSRKLVKPHLSARALISFMKVSLSASTGWKWLAAATTGAEHPVSSSTLRLFPYVLRYTLNIKGREVCFRLTIHHRIIMVYGRVIDLNSFEVEVYLLILIEHSFRDVRYIPAAVMRPEPSCQWTLKKKKKEARKGRTDGNNTYMPA